MKMKEKQNLLWLPTQFVLFIFCSLVFAFQNQSIIENPEKPLNKNAGRVIQLKEILRIKDEGTDFYFKEPWEIDVAEDGSIFVKEFNQIYRFDSNGKFVKKIARKGQGPGEIMREIENIIVQDNEIIFSCATMNKLIKMDLEGNFIEELIPNKLISKLVAYYKNKYIFVDFMANSFEKVEGYQEYNQNLYAVDKGGDATPTGYSFPTTQFFKIISFRGESRPYWTSVTRLYRSTTYKQYVYVCHTQDYLIKQFDLEKFQISRIFRRAYPRAKFKKDDNRPFKFYNDVYRLLIYKGNVWALTSTIDREKGVLIDVFNEEGKFLDNFYLPLLNSKTGDCFYQLYFPMVIKGDYLYAIEHDEDWNFYVAKYEIIDKG
jgi:hypothetical protein